MELAALTFGVTDRGGDLVALAVICVEARYTSVLLVRADRSDRRHASLAVWKEIQRQVASGLATEPMAFGVFHVVLAASAEDRRVQWFDTTTFIAARPEDSAAALDKHLRASLQAYRPGLRLVQTNKGRG